MSKIGRNDPCHCGSGLKYKKCCLAKEQSAPVRSGFIEKPEKDFITELRPDVDKAVDRLMQRLEQGGGSEVGASIEALLKEHPEYHQTNYAMGVYLAQVLRDADGSIPYFEKAIEIFPLFSEAHFNLGMAAQLACQIKKSVTAYRAAERYSGDDEIAALARKQLRKLEQILVNNSTFKSLDDYIENERVFDEAFQFLADKEYARAVEGFSRVLRENPKHVQSYGNMALAYAGLGRKADAMKCFDKALELDPNYQPAMINRRSTQNMEEGKPFIPDQFLETKYYRELIKS
jgi:tetratricopeptide (TPR) repeat protein